MSKQFEIARDVVLDATAEQVFAAVTEGNAAWLFPTPHPAPDGTPDAQGNRVTAWDPPHRYSVRTDGEDGWFNAVEHVITTRDGGTTSLRYVHSGVFVDDWEDQFDGADKHTDFYLHSLGQYVRHFAGRPVTYVAADPTVPGGSAPEAPRVLRDKLGIRAVGDRVHLDVPGTDPLVGEVDYLTEHFVGIRGEDTLYRFYCRTAWGMPVSAAHHRFTEGVDGEKATRAWQNWIDETFSA